MTDAPAMLDAALAYARAGFAVFPVAVGGKAPLVAGGRHAATTDEAAIRAWWSRWPTANIGVATGPDRGLTVLDLDAKHGDPAMMLDELARRVGADPPRTAVVMTGGGGLHLWFRCGAEWSSVADVARRVGVPGVDVRCVGGLVVAPPSLHASGRRYAWTDEGDDGLSAIAPAGPEWIDAALARLGCRAAGSARAVEGARHPAAPVDWSVASHLPPLRGWRTVLDRALREVEAEIVAAGEREVKGARLTTRHYDPAGGGRHHAFTSGAYRVGLLLRKVPPDCLRAAGEAAVERIEAAARAVLASDPERLRQHEVERSVRRGVERAIREAPAEVGERAPARLPAGDALALWHRLGRVGDDGALGGRVADDTEAAAWARSRGLDPVAIDDADLARVLPLDGLDLPPWATSWPASGHRLILPVYDTDGVLAGVRARGAPARFGSKVVPPAGQGAAGLVLADAAARLMLCGCAAGIREVWIVEGETDFLTLACADASGFRRGYRAPRRPSDGVAVLGVYAGAWGYSDTGRALAARIPADATVRIATDNDAEGDRYADDIAATLQKRGLSPDRGRCPEGDVNARWCALPVGRGAHAA